MPLLPTPAYKPVWPLTNGHVHTVYPTLFRPTPQTWPLRKRIATPDGDFLDIDVHRGSRQPADTVVIISHGLEGNARKKYPLGMARAMNRMGYDAVCLNFRGCSGEPNRLLRMYHSGVTDDLHTVIMHALTEGTYQHVLLVGFSMGGNQTLKYLGEEPDMVPQEVRGAVVFSVPCDLKGSARVMDRPINRIYMEYFMKGLRQKVRTKAAMFPGMIDTKGLDSIRTFSVFDDRYTAPIHGFRNALDYYTKASCKPFLPTIRIPCLLVQARDDPFMSPSCYPVACATNNPNLYLEIPPYGGHVGFHLPGRDNVYWMEKRACAFMQQLMG
ncbi:YheT family hydrolase [Desulfoplanes formicivorans]|uniref:Alpha/beta hydrolase n=1 Tax=Desulfoplanes formicivorans TaxID=1592317 RepID=A0A194AJ10_9BACT|nr:alpha/beta fold hydrolase [Desulfoplanes formicivorans]GAU09220.1 alpha/beta hydrolase [Desulfoplanes formicivorans]